MRKSHTIIVDLSLAGFRSEAVAVPPGTQSYRVSRTASSFGSGPAASVSLQSADSMSTPDGATAGWNTLGAAFDAPGSVEDQYAGDLTKVRFRVSTAGGGSPDTRAEFTITFTDTQAAK